jgi:hypothetical protein
MAFGKISGAAAIETAYRQALAAATKQGAPESQRAMVAFMAVRDVASEDTDTLYALLRLSNEIKAQRMAANA